MFSSFGEILRLRVGHTLKKQVRYGLIEFKKQRCAQAAIEYMNRRPFEGRRLFVAFAYEHEEGEQSFQNFQNVDASAVNLTGEPSMMHTFFGQRQRRRRRCARYSTNNLYFANLPVNYETNDLRKMCSSYGDIIGSRVIEKPISETITNRGKYGFIRFGRHLEAHKAITNLRGKLSLRDSSSD